MSDQGLYRKYRTSHVQLTKLTEFLERDFRIVETFRIGDFEIIFDKESNDRGTFRAKKVT